MNEKKAYRGRICIGKDDKGKPINKYFQADSKEELELMKKHLREEYIAGTVQEDILFYQYARSWYQTKKEPFISNGHKAAYMTMFRNCILPEFGMVHLRAISSTRIQKFINRYADSSKTQITLLISILKNIMISALADGIIDRNPALAIVRPKSKKVETRRALTPDERKRVIAACDGNEGLFLAVLYYLGLRRGEALGLRWEDIDWDKKEISIKRDIDFTSGVSKVDTLKTSGSYRIIPIPAPLLNILKNNQAADKIWGEKNNLTPGFLFHSQKGDPMPLSTYKRLWKRLMDKAQLEGITPHYFRHNFITLCFEANIPAIEACRLAGHSSYQVTADIYTHIDGGRIRTDVDRIFN